MSFPDFARDYPRAKGLSRTLSSSDGVQPLAGASNRCMSSDTFSRNCSYDKGSHCSGWRLLRARLLTRRTLSIHPLAGKGAHRSIASFTHEHLLCARGGRSTRNLHASSARDPKSSRQTEKEDPHIQVVPVGTHCYAPITMRVMTTPCLSALWGLCRRLRLPTWRQQIRLAQTRIAIGSEFARAG